VSTKGFKIFLYVFGWLLPLTPLLLHKRLLWSGTVSKKQQPKQMTNLLKIRQVLLLNQQSSEQDCSGSPQPKTHKTGNLPTFWMKRSGRTGVGHTNLLLHKR
jgi:hypothetical protein